MIFIVSKNFKNIFLVVLYNFLIPSDGVSGFKKPNFGFGNKAWVFLYYVYFTGGMGKLKFDFWVPRKG